MTNQKNDPLRSLIQDDAGSVNRDRLASVLKPYVVFDSKGAISFLPPFNKLPNLRKVQIILAASKARSLLIEGMPDGLTSGEIVKLDTMPIGSAKPVIKHLSDTRKIKKNSENRYVLPSYRIDELADNQTGV